MSVSSEWISFKATWGILLLALIARVFLSGQFLLTPEEAHYWQTGYFSQPTTYWNTPILSWLISLSTSIFGNNEFAVRLPAILSITLGSFYIALLAAAMFSWHTGLHVTLLGQGILQFNLLALLISPYSLVFTCWCAVCYHSSQAMHSNRTVEWLLAGFWFGIGLLCKYFIVFLLPCIVFCFIGIKPFRTCLLYPGPWIAFLFSLILFGTVLFLMGDISSLPSMQSLNLEQIRLSIAPDVAYSIRFLFDQSILVTPLVFLLIMISWVPGISRRDMVMADVRFLMLTSLPLFLFFLVFPGFADSGTAWSASLFVTAIILLAGLHSSTRSNFKGHPKLRWTIGCISAYLVTIPLLLQIAYPSLHIPLVISQTKLMDSGWDILGREIDHYLQVMPEQGDAFVFCMDPKLSGVISFYTTGHPQTISLDQQTLSPKKTVALKQLEKLKAEDGLGIISTKAALKEIKSYFEKVELKKELQLQTSAQDPSAETQSYYIVHGFNFRLPAKSST